MTKLFDREIRFSDTDFGVSVKINLFCGRFMDFGVTDVAEDKREWLAQTIQRQVNEIVARERHAAVEEHKAKFNALLQPKVFTVAQTDEIFSPELLLRHVEQDIAASQGKSSMYGVTTWKIGDISISGDTFSKALGDHLVKKHSYKQ